MTARAADNSQLEGNCAVLIGTLSVCPSTRVCRSSSRMAAPRPSRNRSASGRTAASPLLKRSWSGMTITISPFTCSTMRTRDICGTPLMTCTRLRSRRMATSLLPGVFGAVSAGLLALRLNAEGDEGGVTIGLRAALIDSLTVRYFPTLTEEIEYITTKNANNKVMKSAYETSHRS
ncbi:hypothetical protein COMA2_10138 [Candidatus Nitrospira nitrificans]|uniref:Uncharacterized protein n=1 Tax=Candidatus Nitrospira nitrificans TaxID=1742973 RepID=A0A0S4L6J1_9BACT|nr:hypothetical protein COMA2_10138 [Candidatus Nitrospira nitrificans]